MHHRRFHFSSSLDHDVYELLWQHAATMMGSIYAEALREAEKHDASQANETVRWWLSAWLEDELRDRLPGLKTRDDPLQAELLTLLVDRLDFTNIAAAVLADSQTNTGLSNAAT